MRRRRSVMARSSWSTTHRAASGLASSSAEQQAPDLDFAPMPSGWLHDGCLPLCVAEGDAGACATDVGTQEEEAKARPKRRRQETAAAGGGGSSGGGGAGGGGAGGGSIGGSRQRRHAAAATAKGTRAAVAAALCHSLWACTSS